MAMYINTNLASLNATRMLTKTTSNLSTSFERLSSGFRINGAKDDAAGLSISTKMTSQIRGTNMAIRNANDAISMLQVAEGALVGTESALQRARELAVQASNATYTGTHTSGDRQDIAAEFYDLYTEISRISIDTKFNGKSIILAGSTEKFQVGPDGGQTLSITMPHATASALGIAEGYKSNITYTGGGNYSLIYTDTDTGANGKFSFTQDEIRGTIRYIDAALDSVSDMRASLGAYQNRLESLIANLSNVSENTAAARSRIMDADIAVETANLTKNSIMQQAGTAILAQANQQPQIALQLLG